MYTKIYLFFKNLNNGKPYELPQKLVGNSFQFGQGFPLNLFFFFVFCGEFQPITFNLDYNSLSSSQNTNQFLV